MLTNITADVMVLLFRLPGNYCIEVASPAAISGILRPLGLTV